MDKFLYLWIVSQSSQADVPADAVAEAAARNQIGLFMVVLAAIACGFIAWVHFTDR